MVLILNWCLTRALVHQLVINHYVTWHNTSMYSVSRQMVEYNRYLIHVFQDTLFIFNVGIIIE